MDRIGVADLISQSAYRVDCNEISHSHIDRNHGVKVIAFVIYFLSGVQFIAFRSVDLLY